MIKKGMAILSRYPRLRVLFFGVGIVTIVGVSMHVFTKKQDLSKTPNGPASVIKTKPVTLKEDRKVGNSKKYDKLSSKYNREQYQKRLSRGDTMMPGDWFSEGGDADKDTKKDSGKDSSKKAQSKGVVSTAKKAATSSSDKNNELKKKQMMSPRDFKKAMQAAEQSSNNDIRRPAQNQAAARVSRSVNKVDNRSKVRPESYRPVYKKQETPQQAQQRKQRVSSLSSKMQGQLGSMGNSWNMPVASHATLNQEDNTNVSKAISSAKKAADNLANPPQIIKAGTVYFATTQNKVSSTQPGTPVMAKIITGPYKGSKILGGFSTEGKKLLIKFNTMVMDSREKSFSIGRTYAIDTKDGQMAVETDVNNHYLFRYGSLFASAFLEGLGQAYTPSATYCYPVFPSTSNPSGGMSCSGGGSDNPNQVNTKVALMRGVGQFGTKLAQNIGKNFNTPPTVTVAQGTLIGILFMNDVTVPQMKVVQTDPDYAESAGTSLDFLDDNS